MFDVFGRTGPPILGGHLFGHRRIEKVSDCCKTSYIIVIFIHPKATKSNIKTDIKDIMMQDDQSHASNLISITNELQYNKR